MRTALTFIVAGIGAVVMGCGGGGSGPEEQKHPQEEPGPQQFARFEFAPNQCAFDSREAMALAELQYPVEFGYCFIRFIGNTENGKPWPAKSWPSTPRLS